MKQLLNLAIFIYLINPIFPTTHFSDKSEKFLFVNDERSERPQLIENVDRELAEVVNQRFKRDLTTSDRGYENNENITVKVNGSLRSTCCVLCSHSLITSEPGREQSEKNEKCLL